uniref:CSON005353 protein n=1 Tax=Culicoides sonorensis TaxID=179676 RepID=A0A336LYQ4_CULSO
MEGRLLKFLATLLCGLFMSQLFVDSKPSVDKESNRKVPGAGLTIQKSDELYTIKITNIKCSKIDPEAFTNISCRLKAVRGRQGVLDLVFTYKNISEITTIYQLYNRNNNGRYMLYFINIQVDFCKINKENLTFQNRVTQLWLNLWSKFDTAVLHGCPMNGIANYSNFEFDQFKYFVFPSIIPAGDYIFYVKSFKTGTNKSLLEIKVSSQPPKENESNRKAPGADLAVQKADELYTVKITNIQCSKIDPESFTNITCGLKAVRGRQAGDYVFYVRNFETGTNRSLLEIKVSANVKGKKGIMDLSMLNMG